MTIIIIIIITLPLISADTNNARAANGTSTYPATEAFLPQNTDSCHSSWPYDHKYKADQ